MSYAQQFDWEEEDPEATVYLTRDLRIRLTDPDKIPLPRAKCRLANVPEKEYTADSNGIVCVPIPDEKVAGIDIEWEAEGAEQSGTEARFYWRNTFIPDISSIDDPVCSTRLFHLGFDGATLIDQVAAYQFYYNRTVTGNIIDIRDELTNWHDGGDGRTEDTVWDWYWGDNDSPKVEGNSGNPATHSLLLQDYNLNPIASQKCTVSSLDDATIFFDDATDETGRIEFTINEPQLVKVAVFPDGESTPAYVWEIEIDDAFPPADTVEGVLYRLKNLGYYSHNPTNKWGMEESYALQWFQMDHDLPDTGAHDDATIAKLKEIFGS